MSLCNNKNSCRLSIAMFIVSVADHNQDFRFQKSVMFFQPTAIFMEHTLDVLHWYFILEFMWKQNIRNAIPDLAINMIFKCLKKNISCYEPFQLRSKVSVI